MLKKISFLLFIGLFYSSALILPKPVVASSAAAEYLLEFGISFFKSGRYEEALIEFRKVLMLEPQNKTAQNYINSIFEKEGEPFTLPVQKPQRQVSVPPPKKVMPTVAPQISREEAIKLALERLSVQGIPPERIETAASGEKSERRIAGVKVKGSTQLSVGITGDDFIWKQADNNLNEEDSRIFSDNALNRRTNTFDTRVYDRLEVQVDSDNESGVNFHTDLTVDPWSFTGKGPKMTVGSAFGDTADVELKYWSNTGYTIGEIVNTNRYGNSFALPQIKVNDGSTDFTSVNGAYFPPDTFFIPASKIERQFQPVREFWVDYMQEGAKVRVFPLAYQDQAYTSDDPLVLSNNRNYWQQSPWLNRWQAGHVNTGVTPFDFTKGRFDDSLAYATRDSDGKFLTGLRGFSFDISPVEDFTLTSTFATPKDLWQDYYSVDNLMDATRATYRLLDNLSLGALFTYRLGLDENQAQDATHYLWGTDVGYEPIEGLRLDAEVATSKSLENQATTDYKTKSRGNAYYFSATGTYPRVSLMDAQFGYGGIRPDKTDQFFAKYKFYYAHMDEGFYPALSTYRETRDDAFWSRHIHFRKPFAYYYAGLYEPGLTWDTVDAHRIGDGIDIGRDTLGFRVETSSDEKKLGNLLDVRNVHKVDGKLAENVVRDEVTFQVTDQLTSKLLALYQKMPKTKGGFDPFMFDKSTDLPLINTFIEDGKDPSLATGSFGLRYAFTEQVALSGVWEYTNDYTLAYDNFVRGDLNSSSLVLFNEYDRLYRRDNPFLYSQNLFPLPPYKFYNIWKTGLEVSPLENLEIYLDYAINEFKSAGYIDDNINHLGLEVTYLPHKKFSLFLRYAYSQWNDINRMLAGNDKIYLGHHNFSTEFRYMPSKDDELIMQYGESGRAPVGTVTYDPFGGSLATLDTRHIVRLYYRRRF